jgi:deoxyribonuclease IV
MPRLGAHMSIAGGLPRAIERARAHGCRTLQIFTTSAAQWRARPLPADEVSAFRDLAQAAGIEPVVSHASYLINVATENPLIRSRSIAALDAELQRAEALGLLGVVLHPGSRATGTEQAALALVADALRQLLAAHAGGQAMVLLEHTAGQGRSVGYTFEHLAAVVDQLGANPRVGVCLDTCHLLAAGYDLGTEQGYRATFDQFSRVVGLDRLRLFHLNDSKKPCGSRVDRHEHIGHGCLGLEPFRWLLHDPRFAHLPMVIETQKTRALERQPDLIDPLDLMNLQTLRGLMDANDPTRPDPL